MPHVRLAIITAAALALSPLGAAHAAAGLSARASGGAASPLAAEPIKQTVKKLPSGKLPKLGTVSELSAQDCKNVGGKVITVTDDRCGASGKYCRMPDTNAVCIDVLH